jgi:predicted small secreted protein
MTRAPVTVATFAALLAGCGGGDGAGEDLSGGTAGGTAGAIEIELKEQNASGITGLAVLAPRGELTNVVIEMIQSFDIDPQPAHIHKGTCADLDPEPAYALPTLFDGIGGGDVSISLEELRTGGYAVNVHKSVGEPDTYVACGEIA